MANTLPSPEWSFEGTYAKIGVLAASRIVVLERTAVPAGDDLVEVWGRAERAFDGVPRERYGLLIDVRAVKGRNDAEFEKKFVPIRQRIQKGFRRVAILVNTPQGKLQAGRYAREDALPNSVFDDYGAALKWLEEATLGAR
jgi:hypothetical protein